eukprot:scaffold549_cov174-Ochromonas_danica.AAC.13
MEKKSCLGKEAKTSEAGSGGKVEDAEILPVRTPLKRHPSPSQPHPTGRQPSIVTKSSQSKPLPLNHH